MSSVVARRIKATPERTAAEAWAYIAELICRNDCDARASFKKVEGIAASLIADESPRSAPIICRGTGPRLRVYCLYGEAAIGGEDASESELSWSPTAGDWTLYLPCHKSDIFWVKDALVQKGEPFEVYDLEEGLNLPESAEENTQAAANFNFGGLRDL